MDPITVTNLVQDRTHELRRTAEQLRQERALRTTRSADAVASTESAGSTAVQRRPTELSSRSAAAESCTPARPAA
jgi:hypothetical protein